MSITASNLHWQGWTGKRGRNNEQSYSVVYRVSTDDRYDGPQTVINNYGGPMPGDQGYSVGNDIDGDLICQSVTPKRIGDTRLEWMVTAEFTSGSLDTEEPKPGRDGDPTDDPNDWRPVIEVTPQFITTPVYKATYRGKLIGPNFNEDALPHRAVGVEGAVTNSAGQVYSPPLEREHTRWLYNVTAFHTDCPLTTYEGNMNHVNDDGILLLLPRSDDPTGEVVATFEEYQVRLVSMSASFRYHNEVGYWQAALGLLFDEEGWRVDVPDIGVLGKAVAGSDDLHGGYYGVNTTVHSGVAPVHRLTDPHGVPLDAPVNMNGLGHPLSPGQTPVYLRYTVYPEGPLQPVIDHWLSL